MINTLPKLYNNSNNSNRNIIKEIFTIINRNQHIFKFNILNIKLVLATHLFISWAAEKYTESFIGEIWSFSCVV